MQRSQNEKKVDFFGNFRRSAQNPILNIDFRQIIALLGIRSMTFLTPPFDSDTLSDTVEVPGSHVSLGLITLGLLLACHALDKTKKGHTLEGIDEVDSQISIQCGKLCQFVLSRGRIRKGNSSASPSSYTRKPTYAGQYCTILCLSRDSLPPILGNAEHATAAVTGATSGEPVFSGQVQPGLLGLARRRQF